MTQLPRAARPFTIRLPRATTFPSGTFELVKDLSKRDRESLLKAWCL